MGMSNWLLVAMGVLFIVPPVIYKMYFLALAFMIFGLVFGFVEYMAHYYTDHTISMQMWDLIKEHGYKGYIIIGCMLAAWVCLLLHLAIKFKK
jgi:hypothetical protein